MISDEKLRSIAWDYFEKNDLLKERDVYIIHVGDRAEQYVDDDMMQTFVDAYRMGQINEAIC